MLYAIDLTLICSSYTFQGGTIQRKVNVNFIVNLNVNNIVNENVNFIVNMNVNFVVNVNVNLH